MDNGTYTRKDLLRAQSLSTVMPPFYKDEQRPIISVVMMIWKRDPFLLCGSLGTLSHQSICPFHVVVVNANPDKNEAELVRTICDKYYIARVVNAPRDDFSLSWGINVGIKHTSRYSEYIMPTGYENMFSGRAIETLSEMASSDSIIFAPNGVLVKDIRIPDEPWNNWEKLSHQVVEYPPARISTGTILFAPAKWWFGIRGYDEVNHPYNYADSDIAMRAKMSGLEQKSLPWEKAQVLHPWHELSPQYHGVKSDFPNEKLGIIRNPDRWGEIK